MKLLITALNIYFFCVVSFTQQALSFEETEKVRTNIVKSITLAHIYFSARNIKKNQSDKIIKYKNHIQFPSFGYQLLWPTLEIKKSNFTYPDTSWILYEVSFPDDEIKTGLTYFNRGNILLPRKTLIGLNSENDVKFISRGNGFIHPTAKDFDLNPQNPEGYIAFLKFKHFPATYDTIIYTRTENGLLVFTSEKQVKSTARKIFTFEEKVDGSLIQKVEHFIDPKNPDKVFQTKVLTQDAFYVKNINPYRQDSLINFKDFEIKKRYLLDALMRNIYLRKIHDNLSLVEEILEIDTSNWTINCKSSALDIIPNYDEFISPIHLVKQATCGKYFIKEKRPHFIDYICEKENNCEVIIGKTVMHPKTELYGFVRRPNTILKSINRKTGSATYRLDYSFTNKDKNLQRERNLPDLPLPTGHSLIVGGKKHCPNRPPDVNEIIGEDVLYYLVGLDTLTREFHFISGKDIFLSEGSELYGYKRDFGVNLGPLLHENIADWDYETKLAYMQDRAYLYQVEYLQSEHIVLEDEHKIMVEAKGYLFQERVVIRITLNYDDRENVEIKILP